MAYQLKPGIHCVVVRNLEGRIVFHYSQKRKGANDLGPVIPWLAPDKAAQLLRMGMIEEIADEIAAPEILAGLKLHPEIRGCIDALTALSIPFDAGAPTCRQALRDSGARFGNGTIAEAVRQRRGLSRTGGAE